jgi:hypothetical protein
MISNSFCLHSLIGIFGKEIEDNYPKKLGNQINSYFCKNRTKQQMKTFRLRSSLLILSFLAVTTVKAQDNAAPAAPKVDNPNAAEITFETELHDYGTIPQGADGTCEFKFKNTGKEPLIITNARGSCGCTVPTYPKEPIAKGQTAVIKVHYDTKRVGAFTKTVTINSNAKSDTKVLTIKGLVEASEESTDQTMPLKKSSGMPLENIK